MPGEIFMLCADGGGSLNYEVVGGTSAPSSPGENTIWVNTSTAITSHVFSSTKPSSPSAGMVWINTGATSSAAMNVLEDENVLNVYPISCTQYVSGAWVDKTAKTYNGSGWVSWWNGELYKSGDKYTSVTGGWTATTQKYADTVEGSGITGTKPTLTEGSTSLKAALSGNLQSGTLRTVNAIDLADHSTITLKGTLGNSHPYCRLYVTSASSGNYGTLTNYAQLANTTTLDVSSLSGKYYVCIGLYNTNSYEMTSCVMS